VKIPLKKKSSGTKDGSLLYRTKSGDGGDSASWAITDPSKFKALASSQVNSARRPPEFWVREGEKKLIRFVDEGARTAFKVYRFRYNGNFVRHTAPPPGKPDLYEMKMGLKPSFVYLFRIVDIEGYVAKDGKKLTNIPRYYLVGARNYSQISDLPEVTGAPLNEYNVYVKRTGTGTSTNYLFVPQPVSPLQAAHIKAVAELPDWKTVYAPRSVEEQEVIASTYSPLEEEEVPEDRRPF